MSKLKTIRIKEETFRKFRIFGNRTQTDDDIVSALIELAEKTIYQSPINVIYFEKVRHIEELLTGNVR